MTIKHLPSHLTPRQEEAIAALLTGADVHHVLKIVRIGRTTLYRWLKDETFLAAYHARLNTSQPVLSGVRLHHLFEKAVSTLERILDDPVASLPLKITAARIIIESLSLSPKNESP